MVEVSVNKISSVGKVGVYGHYLFNKDIIEDGINKVKLNKNQNLSKVISKKCNVDSMGLHLGYMTEDHINIKEMFGVDVFLYERSIEILKFVKETNPELYEDWLTLLPTEQENNENYKTQAYDLRKKTYQLLKNNKRKLNRQQRLGTDRLRRSLR